MAEQFNAAEFETLANEADLRRQANEARAAQSAAAAKRESAVQQLNALSAGNVRSPVDTRNVPSAPSGQLLAPVPFEQQQFLSRAERPGVPLDTRGGAPAGLRALASQLPEDPESQLAFWKGKLGSDKVDFVDGRYILRNVPFANTGLPGQAPAVRDLLIDEEQMTGADFADALRDAPEMITSVLASFPSPGAAATRGAQLMKYAVWPSLRSALGFQATRQAKEVITRVFSDVPVPPGSFMTSAEQTAWDTLFGAALGAAPIGVGAASAAARRSLVKPAGAVAGTLESPAGLVQAEGILGREALAARTPIGQIPVTAGQLTGFVPWIRIQQIAEKVPIIGSRIAAAKARQLVKERELQRYLVSAEPASQDLGQRLLTELRQPIQRHEQQLAEMKRLLGDEQTAKMAQSFALDAPERSGLEAAAALKTGTEGVYDAWRAENAVNYGRLYAMPEATDRSIPLTGLKKTLNDVVLERQAKREVLTDFPPGESLEGPSLARSSESGPLDVSLGGVTEVPVRGGLPSGIQSLADKVKSFGDFATLQELVDFRGQINDAIKNPDILPGVDDYMRKRLSGAITDSIQSYASKVPNKEFKSALDLANSRYKEKVDLFDSPGVRQLLLPREGRFAVNLDEYADSIFRSGRGAVERYQRVKSLLGPASDAVQQFRQHFLQRIGGPAVNPVTRSLDFATLADAVQKLPKEIADDLFPQSRAAILEASRAGQFAQGKVNYDDIAGLISQDKLTVESINKIKTAQDRLDNDMRNIIFRSVREGKIDDILVQPDTFVDTVIMSPKVPLSQLKDTMDLISFRNPQLADDIRFKQMAKMFREAADAGAQENITLGALGRPERTIDPKKFAAFFDGPDKQARLREVLGPQRFEILNNFNKHLATRSFAQEAAGSAGGLFSGNFLLSMFNVKNWAKGAQIVTMAALLSDSKLLRIISTPPPSGVTSSIWNKYLLRTAVLTPEFRRALSSEVPEDQLQSVAEQIQAQTRP